MVCCHKKKNHKVSNFPPNFKNYNKLLLNFPINSAKSLLKIKFIYSEKATKFFEISTLLLSYVVPVKSK